MIFELGIVIVGEIWVCSFCVVCFVFDRFCMFFCDYVVISLVDLLMGYIWYWFEIRLVLMCVFIFFFCYCLWFWCVWFCFVGVIFNFIFFWFERMLIVILFLYCIWLLDGWELMVGIGKCGLKDWGCFKFRWWGNIVFYFYIGDLGGIGLGCLFCLVSCFFCGCCFIGVFKGKINLIWVSV